MRILVYEYASGGGIAGRRVPASLAREGAAMRAALVGDLLELGHTIVTTAERSRRGDLPDDVEVVILPDRDRLRQTTMDRLIAGADAVWLIAPESARRLERLTCRVERQRKLLLGASAAAIHRAADKARLPRRLAAVDVRHPETRTVGRGERPVDAAAAIGFPIVVKPSRGAGSDGVSLVRNARALPRAVAAAQRVDRGAILVQQFVDGAAASVSLLSDGCRAVALSVNAQHLGPVPTFAYRGGHTPFDHPLACRAAGAALDACRAFPGLRGFVGVDMILTASEVFVIEVNPRLTTTYLGVRAAIDENLAALSMEACAGGLPPAPQLRRRVDFTASGRVVMSELRPAARGAA